jgi:hypothetical protein
LHRAVIVAMPVVMKMQASAHQKINVIVVRHALVVAVLMRAAASGFGANRRILVADFQNALVNVRFVNRMQMTVVQKIRVIPVFDLRMPASRAVRVRMVFVNCVRHKIHSCS